MSDRIEVLKTNKLFINGAFVRSESGRSYRVNKANSKTFLANLALASRKDLREAVLAAKNGLIKWQSATAFNKSQILYRIAEIMEGRREQFVEEIIALEGLPKKSADLQVSQAIDLWIWYAGWSDKISVIAGSENPINGPFYNFTSPEPIGVVGAFAPDAPSLLGLVETLAPIIASGNSALLIASQRYPLSAVTMSEVFATSDVPAGVINILTGNQKELAPWLASHMEISGMDITSLDKKSEIEIRKAATSNLKRIGNFDTKVSPERILAFMDYKTIWHPIGI